MNKLMGFYELREMSLPSIPWKEYTPDVELDPNILWTIRTAVYKGKDLNLPRKVGVDSIKAKRFGDKIYNELIDIGMVIYYPYFVAKKSGNLNVYQNKVVIEAVKNDLWNLVSLSDREVTIIINEGIHYNGNAEFLEKEEIKSLMNHVPEIRKLFRSELISGENILLEWSYAFNCDINARPIGNKYLVFYEARTIKEYC